MNDNITVIFLNRLMRFPNRYQTDGKYVNAIYCLRKITNQYKVINCINLCIQFIGLEQVHFNIDLYARMLANIYKGLQKLESGDAYITFTGQKRT